jgi:uncharacterized protein YecE (DUF72 family)
MARIRVGTMGWSYGFWVGNFYPEGVDSRGLLSEYAKRFDTVEIDSTFYRIPSQSTVGEWKAQTPGDFVFSAKFPRRITHVKKLEDCEGDVRVFISNISLLDEKLGPLLLQFPPFFKPDKFAILKDFLAGLPKGKRFAVEVRDRRWLEDRFHSMLRDAGVALAMLDRPDYPSIDVLTADFAYIRLEGDPKEIKGTTGAVERDREADIEEWAKRIIKMAESTEVFVYFSKYFSSHPPTDARRLLSYLSTLA